MNTIQQDLDDEPVSDWRSFDLRKGVISGGRQREAPLGVVVWLNTPVEPPSISMVVPPQKRTPRRWRSSPGTRSAIAHFADPFRENLQSLWPGITLGYEFRSNH